MSSSQVFICNRLRVYLSDANGETITREIIVGIVTQRDLLNYIMKSDEKGGFVDGEA